MMGNLVNIGGVLVNPYRAGGYDGAQITRKRRLKARHISRSQDEDRLIGKTDRETLRLECLHLRRNNSVVAGVCERFADNVVGPDGILPQAKTASQDWNDQAESYWREWSKVADYRGLFSLREIQRLVVQSRLHSGEIGFILTDGGQIQAIEPDRIATPSDKDNDPDTIEGIGLEIGRAHV